MKKKIPSAMEIKKRLGALRKPWDWERDKARLLGERQKAPEVTPVTIVHDGRDVTGKAVYRNKLYREAKAIANEMREVLLTKDEAWRPTERNIRKCQMSEASPRGQALARRFQECMAALGAPSSERDPNRFRRGR